MLFFRGVDVSKAELDVALLLPNRQFKSKVFANDAQGFSQRAGGRPRRARGPCRRLSRGWTHCCRCVRPNASA